MPDVHTDSRWRAELLLLRSYGPRRYLRGLLTYIRFIRHMRRLGRELRQERSHA